jgi:hypothetical protein
VANKYIFGNSYEVDPETIRYDTKICGFNSKKPDNEYQSLKEQIRATGQTSPAFMRSGLLGDGVHRAKACIELGVKLLVVDIDPDIDDKEYVMMCNENTFTARNDTAAQQAIKGYQLTRTFGYTDAEVTKRLGIKDRRLIGYVRRIAASPLDKEYGVLETLATGKRVNIEGRYTSSIDTSRRIVASIEEARATEKVKIEEVDVAIRYDDLLNTEASKEEFWTHFGTLQMSTDTKLRIVGLLNTKYKPLEDAVRAK